MAVPIATTMVQVLQPVMTDWGGEPGDDTYTAVGEPVRAHLSYPSGYAASAPESNTSGVELRLLCDPVPIEPNMIVRDLSTDLLYQVTWCLQRSALLPHTMAGVRYVTSTS